MRNKFETLTKIIDKNFDFLVSETRFDDSFPTNRSLFNGCRSFRKDCNSFVGGAVVLLK